MIFSCYTGENIPQFYFHPFVSFILPGSMLIILSCLLITGGELVALGEAAEDQVRHQKILGDPWWNVWKKHRKTIGKPQEKWREPLSVGNPRSHPHGVVIPLLIHIFESPIFGKPYIKFPVSIWRNPFQSQTVWWAKTHASIHLLGSIRIFVGAGYLTCWSQNPVFRIGYMMILIVWLMM